MAYETVIGRLKEDMEKYGKKCSGFIGKHIVGKGEDAHLTTRVLLDLLRPHVILICGKRGTGKCVDGDTLITLDDGSVVPIKDLENNDSYIYGLNDRLKISPLEKSEFFKRKVEKLLHVKLRSGREIKLTPEHPLLTINGWNPVNRLCVGNRIAVPREIRNFGNKLMKENEIKLISYLIAEGHLSNQFILFSNMDNGIFEDFKNCVNEFDNNLKIDMHSKVGCYRVSKNKREVEVIKIVRNKKGQFNKGTCTRIKKSSLRIWLEKMGVYGKLSKEKQIPGIIFKLPEHQLSIFLNRLFSCDGSIYKRKASHGNYWEISYSTSSKLLAHQIQHLLLRFGILSRIRHKKTKCNGKYFDTFEIVILGENLIKFITKIGFFGEKSKKQQLALEDLKKISRHFSTDTVPKEIWAIYRPKNWADVGREAGYSYPKAFRSGINYAPTRQKLAKIAEADQNEYVQLLANSDIFWDEITEIRELTGDFTVYDISVPKFHNFVADDIIVHNSYAAGVIMEEIASLPDEFLQNLSVVVIDTMGIFWSMKKPNDQQALLLKEWNLDPKGFSNVKMFVPYKQMEEYERSGLPVDAGISVPPWEFTAEEWALAFNLKRTDPLAVSLEKNVNQLLESKQEFMIEDLITVIRDDNETADEIKDALENLLTVANQWGVFGTEGVDIDKLVQPGQISIIDVSRLRSIGAWSVRNFLVALIARKIYQYRVVARKEEEVAKMEGTELKKRYPMVWLIADEAHNWAPSDMDTVSSAPFLTIAKEGREPGVSLIMITQMPNKIHQDILSQTDLVISHRLTSKADLDALHAVMQTYMQEDLWKYINSLPRWPGAAVILDDNLEKIFSVNIRPRVSWHAGGTAIIV